MASTLHHIQLASEYLLSGWPDEESVHATAHFGVADADRDAIREQLIAEGWIGVALDRKTDAVVAALQEVCRERTAS